MGALVQARHSGGDAPRLGSREQATSRFDTIDLLRGLSILGVVLLHSRLWLLFSGYHVEKGLPRWLWPMVFAQGGNGVSAFFAISGFLITSVSLRRFGSLGKMRVLAFYRIRFARIMPLLALLLAVLSALHLLGIAHFHLRPQNGSLPRALLAALTFHLNWYEVGHGYLPAPWTVLWSLSVEEVFYLVFPLLCVVLLRVTALRPVFVCVLVGLIVFGPFARMRWYSKSDVWLEQSYLGNVDNIALGCLLALGTERLRRAGRWTRTRWPKVCELVGVGLSLFVVVWAWPRTLFGWQVKRAIGQSGTDVTVLGLGVCLIMMGSVLRDAKGWRWTAPVRWLGRYSYEVYLTHEFVVMGVLSLFLATRRGAVAFWIASVVLFAAALGYGLSRSFSEPMNRLLRGAPLPAELAEG